MHQCLMFGFVCILKLCWLCLCFFSSFLFSSLLFSLPLLSCVLVSSHLCFFEAMVCLVYASYLVLCVLRKTCCVSSDKICCVISDCDVTSMVLLVTLIDALMTVTVLELSALRTCWCTYTLKFCVTLRVVL